MGLDPSAVWDFAKEVIGATRPDRGRTLATVTRIGADGTVWVTTGDGGEAPASSAAAGVSVGDTVTLEWDGASMGIRGNVSNPSPAGSVIRRAVEHTQGVASAAQKVADAVNQHFFADGHGIHVTEATQEEWDESHTGANVLINSIGQLFRDGLNNLLTLTTEGNARALTIWDGLGNAASNVRAVFGETIQLGSTASGNYVTIDSNGMGVAKGGDSVASFGSTARIGKSNGTRVTIAGNEVKIVPENRTQNAITFGADEEPGRSYINYGSVGLNIGQRITLEGMDSPVEINGDTWVKNGLLVGETAYGAAVGISDDGQIHAAGGIFANVGEDGTGEYTTAGLLGSGSYFYLRGGTGNSASDNKWRFSKSSALLQYNDGSNWVSPIASSFDVDSITILSNTSIAAGGIKTGTTSITKSGWTPIAISGWNADTRYALPARLYLSARGNGTGTISWGIYNPGGSAQTPTVTAVVLWVRS